MHTCVFANSVHAAGKLHMSGAAAELGRTPLLLRRGVHATNKRLASRVSSEGRHYCYAAACTRLTSDLQADLVAWQSLLGNQRVHIDRAMGINVDTELFIAAVKNQPVIWDTTSEHYHDRIKKRGAWFIVCEEFFEGFDEKSGKEKNEIERKVPVNGLMMCSDRLNASSPRKVKGITGSAVSGRGAYQNHPPFSAAPTSCSSTSHLSGTGYGSNPSGSPSGPSYTTHSPYGSSSVNSNYGDSMDIFGSEYSTN
ncbi:hypothetical protein J6590_025818 [Homalodisca vitripennis]|nr:hypothetical protein J6590_025818 [Homalodisca vitripennis]